MEKIQIKVKRNHNPLFSTTAPLQNQYIDEKQY